MYDQLPIQAPTTPFAHEGTDLRYNLSFCVKLELVPKQGIVLTSSYKNLSAVHELSTHKTALVNLTGTPDFSRDFAILVGLSRVLLILS